MHIIAKTPREFSTSACAMVQRDDLQVSSDSSPESITIEATTLVDDGAWTLCLDGKGLERNFKFKGFKATWVCCCYMLFDKTDMRRTL